MKNLKLRRRFVNRFNTSTGILAIVIVSVVWAGIFSFVLINILTTRFSRNFFEVGISVVLALIVSFMLVGGLRASSFALIYPFIKLKHRQAPETNRDSTARVAILLCTANDFNPTRLKQTMRQTYPLVDTIILDDSSKEQFKSLVDDFAAENSVQVVRRTERTGYKAGNLNHFFTNGPRYDYYVIVDSDQILSENFVEKALQRISQSNDIGIVQGRQLIHDTTSPFARRFSGLLQTHIAVTQAARSIFGFSMFMGRGALISDRCIRTVGGFPEVVMEDLAFSVEVRKANFTICWAPDVTSTEDFPVDYQAFRKQQSKFAQGSMEFLRRYLVTVLRSNLHVREKIDLIADTMATPVSNGLAIFMFAVNLLPPGQFNQGFISQQVGVLLALCAIVPLLPEFFRRVKSESFFRAVLFVFQAIALYASTLWLTLWAMLQVLFGGRARFIVTPKTAGGRNMKDNVFRELSVMFVALFIAVAVAKAPGAAMVFVMMAGSAIWMSFLDQKTYSFDAPKVDFGKFRIKELKHERFGVLKKRAVAKAAAR